MLLALAAVSCLVVWVVVVAPKPTSCPSESSTIWVLYWAVLRSYLGHDSVTEVASGVKTPVRLAVTSILLCGVVIWAVYQGTLTAELALRVTRMPFSDLNEFLSSDYQ